MHRTSSRYALVTVAVVSFLSLGIEGSSSGSPADLAGANATRIDRLAERVEECSCCCSGRFAPVCARSGASYVNACEARCAGAEIVSPGVCTPEHCGGPNGLPCDVASFCELPPGCDALAFGQCEAKPEFCTRVLAPVCGCNGQTYGNDCERRHAGVPLAHEGACYDPPGPCKGNDHCAPDDFCQKRPGACEEEGICGARPEGCIQVFDPVCGCDGRTYGNGCEAARAGTSLAHEGECRPATCDTDEDCGPEAFCEVQACGLLDVSPAGICVPKPDACVEVFAPVCGCDEHTYGNDCLRRRAGVSKAHDGVCDVPPVECKDNAGCDRAQWCAKEPGVCGDAAGECQRRPQICPLVAKPVCGCDGNTWGNACSAAHAGVNVVHDGPCEARPRKHPRPRRGRLVP
ncbi:MAG: Kazal-type serine protease inhibitor domain-containing protein [Myxococcota bacterium]